MPIQVIKDAKEKIIETEVMRCFFCGAPQGLGFMPLKKSEISIQHAATLLFEVGQLIACQQCKRRYQNVPIAVSVGNQPPETNQPKGVPSNEEVEGEKPSN